MQHLMSFLTMIWKIPTTLPSFWSRPTLAWSEQSSPDAFSSETHTVKGSIAVVLSTCVRFSKWSLDVIGFFFALEGTVPVSNTWFWMILIFFTSHHSNEFQWQNIVKSEISSQRKRYVTTIDHLNPLDLFDLQLKKVQDFDWFCFTPKTAWEQVLLQPTKI